MKKKIMIIAAVIFMLTLALCSCNSANENTAYQSTKGEALKTAEDTNTDKSENTVYSTEIYTSTLDKLYKAISEQDYDMTSEDGTDVIASVAETVGDNPLEKIGYLVQDVSGDGIPELLIGCTVDGDNSIYLVYSGASGEANLSLEGFYRSNYGYLGEGKFSYSGSAGALYHIFGTYTISKDGSTFECNDYYFTYEKDETLTDIDFYHNTIGKMDVKNSEKLDITEEDFYKIEEEIGSKTIKLNFTPFSQYKKTQREAKPQVSAQWAEKIEYNYSQYKTYIDKDSENSSEIIFVASEDVTDFKLLKLSLTDVDESGNASFSSEELYSQETLTPKIPLNAVITFHGDSPEYGISYNDSKGVGHRFTLTVSGKDGSLVLEEY